MQVGYGLSIGVVEITRVAAFHNQGQGGQLSRPIERLRVEEPCQFAKH